MNLTRVIFLLMMIGCFQINGVIEVSEKEPQKRLPDELIFYILSFAAKSNTTSETIKQLAILRLVGKQFDRVASDASLLKMLITLHADDDDYQITLNKMLFKASCADNDTVIDILSQVPEAKLQPKDFLTGPLNSATVEELDDDVIIDNETMSFFDTNVNNVNSFGYTPLLYAAEQGHKNIVQKLLAHDALVVIKNNDNDTALILASRKGHREVVKQLLKIENVKGCIDEKGFGRDSAFLSAAKQCLYTCDEYKESNYLKILTLLANKGADVNSADAADLSAMDWATKEGKARLINKLLDLGAHFSKENKVRLEVCLIGISRNEEITELMEKILKLEKSAVEIEVEFQLKHKPYWLSLRIGKEMYKCETGTKFLNVEFANKISVLVDETLVKIGDAIVEKVYVNGSTPKSIVNNSSYDPNDYRLAFELLFALVLYQPYDWAEEENNQLAMQKIREILKPIFRAFPNKANSIYGNNLEKYGLND